MHQVLFALSMCSVTSAASMDGDSGGGYYSHAVLADPFGKRAPADEFPHIYFDEKYAAAETDDERERVYLAAVDALDEIRRSRGDRSCEESWEQLRRRIGSFAGWEAHKVALETRTGITTVRKARRELGVDLDYGKPPAGTLDQLDLRARKALVQARADAGMSERQIAFALGIPRTTVQRDLGRAA